MTVKLAFIFILMLLAGVSPTQADETLPAISVTASRNPISLSHASSAVSIISREQIEQSGQTLVADLLQQVPGVNVSRSGGIGAQTQVRIRGAEANQVLVLIDGVEVNDPASGAEFNFAHLLTHNIERIEILRGAQSALWGSDALAGVIHIITRSGTENTLLNTRYGVHGTFQNSASLQRAGEEGWAGVSVSHLDSSGENISQSGSENDGYDNITSQVSLGWQPYKQHEFGLGLRHTNATNEFDEQSITGLAVPIDANAHTDVEQFYGRLYWQSTALSNRLHSRVELTQLDTDNDTNDAFGLSRTRGYQQKIAMQSTWWFSELRDHSITLLAERSREKYRQSGSFPQQSQQLTNYSYAAEYRQDLGDGLSFDVSARLDDNDRFDDQFTYRLGMSYELVPSGTVLYAARATGAKNPTFIELFGFSPGNFIGNPDLKPETSDSWEVGIRQSWLQGALQMDMAWFNERLRDEIATVFGPPDEVVNLDGRSKRSGLEIELSMRMLDNIDGRFRFTHLRSRANDTTGNFRTEIRRPRNQASASLGYRFLQNNGYLQVSADYVGERSDEVFNNDSILNVEIDDIERTKLNDYVLVNASFAYQLHPQVKWSFTINNLLDDDYEDVTGFETLGFSAYTGLEFSWN